MVPEGVESIQDMERDELNVDGQLQLTPVDKFGEDRGVKENDNGEVIIDSESSERADEVMGGLSNELGVDLSRVN